MSRPALLSPEGQRRFLAELGDGMSEAEAAELHERAAGLFASPPPTAEELPELAALAAELAGRTT